MGEIEKNTCHRQKGELELAIPKEGLSVKESLHLSASEYGMGSWPKRCGWEPGPRRRGGLGCTCVGWDFRTKTEPRANVFLPNHIYPDLSLPGNQETMVLTAVPAMRSVEGHGSSWRECWPLSRQDSRKTGWYFGAGLCVLL